MTARDRVLARVREAVARASLSGSGEDGEGAGSGSGAGVPGAPAPGAHGSGEERARRFVRRASAVETTVERVESTGGVPAAVAAHLREAGLEATLAVHGDLRSLDWVPAGIDPGGDPADDEAPALLRAFAGVAETGSLCLTSEEVPLRAAFLPDTLLVVLDEDDLVGPLDELWRRVRGEGLASTLVLVTGPSRTADIEQSLVLGAHGPRRLHVLLVAGPSTRAG